MHSVMLSYWYNSRIKSEENNELWWTDYSIIQHGEQRQYSFWVLRGFFIKMIFMYNNACSSVFFQLKNIMNQQGAFCLWKNLAKESEPAFLWYGTCRGNALVVLEAGLECQIRIETFLQWFTKQITEF